MLKVEEVRLFCQTPNCSPVPRSKLGTQRSSFALSNIKVTPNGKIIMVMIRSSASRTVQRWVSARQTKIDGAYRSGEISKSAQAFECSRFATRKHFGI